MSWGNVVILFGVVVLYSFIAYGIGELYNEESGLEIGAISEPEEDAGWTSAVVGFFSTVYEYTSAVFKIALYQNEHIPSLINKLVITPINFMTLGIIVYLLRGGGS